MKKIKVCGVGSVLLGDDAVGPYTARWIAANYEFGENVEVEDLGTPGLDLIAYMTGMDVLILIDSVDNHEPAGTVTVYDKALITSHRPAVRLDIGAPLSESVQNAIPLVVEKVLERVVQHGGSYRKRDVPLDADIWWENARMEVVA